MMKKLKPCPFCGGIDAFVTNIRQIDKTSLWPFAERSVCCPDCGMSVTFGYEMKSPQALTDEEAEAANRQTIAEWNRRADDEKG